MQSQTVNIFPKWVVDDNDRPLLNVRGPRPFGSLDREELELREGVRDIRVAVQQYADVLRIPEGKIDKKILDSSYEYLRVHTGMNINVPEGRIRELRFYLAVLAEGKQIRDVFVVDGFPNDEIEHIPIVKGKVTLKVDPLLNLLPFVGPLVGSALEVAIDPWEIDWGYDRLKVGFSGGNTDTVDWYLSSENVNQSFDCYVILKKRKPVKHVNATAWAKWNYEPPGKGVADWFQRRFGKHPIKLMSDRHEFAILG